MNIKNDIQYLLAESGWSALRLASMAGVNKDSLYRLINGDRKGVNSSTLEKLWPYIYGDKRPDNNLSTSCADSAPEASLT